MRKETQAYIAYCAGRLGADWDTSSVWDKDREESIPIDKNGTGLKLQKEPFQKGCTANKSIDGINHCIVDADKGHHVCLSVYGKLFDGYDHASTSHFSGIVNDDNVELYDYSESDFFRFEKA